MKKFLWLFLLLLIPFNVSAKTKSVYTVDLVSYSKTISVGEEIDIDFDINLDVENNGFINSMKICLDYNSSILEYKYVFVEDYNAKLEKIEDKNYIVLELNNKELTNKKNVSGTIVFSIKDTNKTNTEFKFTNIETIFINENNEDNGNYKENISKNITYIISKKEEEKSSNSNQNIKKSDNNYLKDLIIEGYDIEFSKTKNTYEIELDNDINKIDVSVILEDDNATYEIKGNDNLKDNNDCAYVVVESESGKKNTYVIKVKRKEQEEVKTNDNKSIIIIAVAAGLIILLLIINKIKNRRIDRLLNRL